MNHSTYQNNSFFCVWPHFKVGSIRNKFILVFGRVNTKLMIEVKGNIWFACQSSKTRSTELVGQLAIQLAFDFANIDIWPSRSCLHQKSFFFGLVFISQGLKASKTLLEGEHYYFLLQANPISTLSQADNCCWN